MELAGHVVVITGGLIAVFCPRIWNKYCNAIYTTGACEQQSTHLRVCWTCRPLDHCQVTEVFLESFCEIGQAGLLLTQNLKDSEIARKVVQVQQEKCTCAI